MLVCQDSVNRDTFGVRKRIGTNTTNGSNAYVTPNTNESGTLIAKIIAKYVDLFRANSRTYLASTGFIKTACLAIYK